MPDGYFRTGDLGYLDPEGYLFIVDRKKDIIIRGGENISCIEVEGAITRIPASPRPACLACPTNSMAKCGRGLSGQGRLLGQRGGTARFPGRTHRAVQDSVRFWQVHEPLPRLGTEKVDKRSLRETYAKLWTVKAG
jgi:acyl-CoA synthetase (AMP-forming)/AMP-acid ligase II